MTLVLYGKNEISFKKINDQIFATSNIFYNLGIISFDGIYLKKSSIIQSDSWKQRFEEPIFSRIHDLILNEENDLSLIEFTFIKKNFKT